MSVCERVWVAVIIMFLINRNRNRSRKERSLFGLILCLIFALSLQSTLANASTNIDNCTELNVTGETYYLTADIINSTETICFDITADNIILDCQDHLVDGAGDINIKGIWMSGRQNITIKNCEVKEWSESVYFQNSNGCTLTDNTIDSSSYGVVSVSSSNNLTNNIITSNSRGLYFESCSNNNITGNIVTLSWGGLYDNDGSGNEFRDNIVSLSTSYGCRIHGDSILYNNLFNNTNNFYVASNNSWNTTKQIGTRIYSDGTQIGGNYWTHPNGTGYSDLCIDLNTDGFCDNLYNLSAGNVDYLPLSDEWIDPSLPQYSSSSTNSTLPGTPVEHRLKWTDDIGLSGFIFSFDNGTGMLVNDTWSSMTGIENWSNVTKTINSTACLTFRWKVYANDTDNQWTDSNIYTYTDTTVTCVSDCFILDIAGETYYLTADIIDSTTGVCFNITADNITLDCQNHLIDGIDGANSYGVYSSRLLDTSTNITVKNCVVTDWSDGFYFYDSSNNTVTDSIISSHVSIGIRIYNSSDNTFVNNTIELCDGGVLFVDSANHNTFYDNEIRNCGTAGIAIGTMIETPYGNLFYNNLLNNTDNYFSIGTVDVNLWNTTKQSGTRIYSAGTQIGGNYYTNSTGNGYSDTCADTDTDGFCDSIYNLSGSTNVDYLPLSDEWIDPSLPQYSSSSTNSTLPGTPVEHRLKWTDDIGLSGFIFSFDNGTGMLVNDTWSSMTGIENWSNVTKTINSTACLTFRWKVYANDTDDNKVGSDIYTYTNTIGTCVSDCTVLDIAGTTYYLAANIINSTNTTCFNILANNIVLDCQNYLVDGVYDDGVEANPITINGNNVTIRNCNMSDWSTYITVESGYNLSVIENNTFRNGKVNPVSPIAIYLKGSGLGRNIIRNNVIELSAGVGIVVAQTWHDVISNNLIWGNGYGIFLQNGWNTSLVDNIIIHNTDYGGLVVGMSTLNCSITGGSIYGNNISGSSGDYYLVNLPSGQNNRVIDTNFTAPRGIYCDNNDCDFIYSDSVNEPWLKTTYVASGTIYRTIFDWNDTLLKWNDSGSMTLYYDLWDLQSLAYYDLYNNSVKFDTLQTDVNGVLPQFSVNLGSEHEITVEYNETVVITITSPVADTRYHDNLAIETTISGLVDYAYYNITNSTSVVTSFQELTEAGDWDDTFDTTITLDDDCTLIVWANDTYNNVTTKSVNFSIDNTNPYITWAGPLLDNSSYYSSAFNLDINFYDANLYKTLINITNSTGHEVYSNQTDDENVSSHTYVDLISGLSDGTYTVEASATDDGSSPKLGDTGLSVKFADEDTFTSKDIETKEKVIAKDTQITFMRKTYDVLDISADLLTTFDIKITEDGEHYKFGWTFDKKTLKSDDFIVSIVSPYAFTLRSERLVFGDQYIDFSDISGSGYKYILKKISDKEYHLLVDLSKQILNDKISSIIIDPVVGGLNTWTEYANFTIDTVDPYIAFAYPTPDDMHITYADFAYINVTVTDDSNTTSFIDWNRSLVGWWRFDNSSDLTDHSTYSNNGTNYGSTYTDNGKFGGARDFTTDHINCGNDTSLDITDTITIEVWVKPSGLDDTGGHQIVTRSASWRNEGYVLRIGTGGGDYLQFVTLAPANDLTSSFKVENDVWYHVVAVQNGTSYKRLYINGVLDKENAIVSAIVTSGADFKIGVGFGEYFNGSIDEVRIHNRALSSAEINASYNSGLHRLYHNFTSLTEGNYTYRAYAQGLAGNVNQTEERTITVIYPVENLNTTETFLTIQAAIDDSDTFDGHILRVLPGTYTITSDINVDKSITITGNVTNPESVVVQYSSLANLLVFDMRANNIIIEGIKTVSGKSGFYFDQGATGCKISHCIIEDAYESGIYIYNGNNHVVEHTIITNPGQGGNLGYSNGVYTRAASTRVNNCTITSDKVQYMKWGINLEAGPDQLVTETTIMGAWQAAIRAASGVKPVTITNNDIDNATEGYMYEAAISLAGHNDGSIVSGNHIDNVVASSGIAVYNAWNVTISWNLIGFDDSLHNIRLEGIRCEGLGGSGANRVEITSNRIYNTGYAAIILVGDSSNAYIYGNDISDCNNFGADGTGDWDYASIHINADSDSVIVYKNSVSDGINGIQTWGNNSNITTNRVRRMGLTYNDTKIVGGRTYMNSGILIGSNFGTAGDYDPTGTSIYHNRIEDNHWGLFYSSDLTNGVVAEYNWWGHSSGPSKEGFGFGDNVSANVDFSPWCADTACSGSYYLSIDFNYTVIAFGTLDHNTANNPAGNDYQIGIDTNWMNVSLVHRSPVPMTLGSYNIPNSNFAYNYTINSTSYPTLYDFTIDRTIYSLGVCTVYPGYYLSIPQYQTAGLYTTTMTVDAVCV